MSKPGGHFHKPLTYLWVIALAVLAAWLLVAPLWWLLRRVL